MYRAKTERKKKKKKTLGRSSRGLHGDQSWICENINITRAGIPESYISSQTGKVEEGILIFYCWALQALDEEIE